MISRRTFLLQFSAFFLTLGSISCSFWKQRSGNAEEVLKELALRHPSWKNFGEACLQNEPAQPRRSDLVQILLGPIVQTQVTEETLRSTLAVQITDDYKRGRTSVVSNWILSKTEVSIFCFAALA